VSFTAPASDGGSAITAYTVSCDPGAVTKTGAASPITVTGLTNGTAYTCTVSATNSVGAGTASAPSNSFTPRGVPGAPTAVSAAGGAGQATVSFTAPASDGGSAVTGYTVSCDPGAVTKTGAASPLAVTGLTNGTAYTCTVTATNSVGTGPASAASNSVTPATLPGAPTAVSAIAGDAAVTVSFTAPASDGGSAVTGYTVSCDPGAVTKTGAASRLTVTGLTNGTAYTCTARASNSTGIGTASVPSNSVTPTAPAAGGGGGGGGGSGSSVPGAPGGVSAGVGDGQVTVSFNAPASGGTPITGYTVNCSPGGVTQTGTGSPITVTGLTNGVARTCTVTARNAIGDGPASATSNSVTPIAGALSGPMLTGSSLLVLGGTAMFSVTADQFVGWDEISIRRPDGSVQALADAEGRSTSWSIRLAGDGAYVLTGTMRTGAAQTRFQVQSSLGSQSAAVTRALPESSPGSITVQLARAASASIVWPATAFGERRVVLRLVAQPPAAVRALPAGSSVVNATAYVDGASNQSLHLLGSVVELHFNRTPSGSLPLVSETGRSWRPLRPLPSAKLPENRTDGYFRDARGVVHVYTRHLSYFAVARKLSFRVRSAKTVGRAGLAIQLTSNGPARISSSIVRLDRARVAGSTRSLIVARDGSLRYRVPTAGLRPGVYRIQIRAASAGQSTARTVKVRVTAAGER
jgi:hypothetical protein